MEFVLVQVSISTPYIVLIEDELHISAMANTQIARFKEWARTIKRDVIALWLAGRDPRVPWIAKTAAAVVAAYALSPIDLVPDFIPVLGYLDDLIIVPLGIMLAVRLIPPPLMADLRLAAMEYSKPQSQAGLAAVVAIWLCAIILTIWCVLSHS